MILYSYYPILIAVAIVIILSALARAAARKARDLFAAFDEWEEE